MIWQTTRRCITACLLVITSVASVRAGAQDAPAVALRAIDLTWQGLRGENAEMLLKARLRWTNRDNPPDTISAVGFRLNIAGREWVHRPLAPVQPGQIKPDPSGTGLHLAFELMRDANGEAPAQVLARPPGPYHLTVWLLMGDTPAAAYELVDEGARLHLLK